MVALHITLHTLRAKHASIEWKLFPRLESDNLIAPDLQLDAALLATETAMSPYQSFGRILGFALPAARRLVIQMRAVTLDEQPVIYRRPSHETPFSNAVVKRPATCVCTEDKRSA